jgi:PAS domain-containing protein
MPAMDLPGYESESKRALEAQLRATLDVIPAYTWYADPSGALTFVNKRHADYLGLPKDHPLRFGIATGAAWDSHIPFLHPRPDTGEIVWSDETYSIFEYDRSVKPTIDSVVQRVHPLDHLFVVVQKIGDALQQRLQRDALPQQLPIGETDLRLRSPGHL